MKKRIRIGDVINGVTIINLISSLQDNGLFRKKALAKCVCGNYFTSRLDGIVSGHTTSCGCYRVSQLRKAIFIEYEVGEKINGIKFLGRTDINRANFECPKCFSIFNALIRSIKSGHTSTCGCTRSENTRFRFTTHDKCRTKEYLAWQHMKNRCYNPNNKRYIHYGGRGIKVCGRWLNNFEYFLEDMGLKPTPKHSLDRFPNNDGDYEKSNCRWATVIQQNRNKRDNVILEMNGIRMTATEWGNKLSIDRCLILSRARKNKFSIEEILQPQSIYKFRKQKSLADA